MVAVAVPALDAAAAEARAEMLAAEEPAVLAAGRLEAWMFVSGLPCTPAVAVADGDVVAAAVEVVEELLADTADTELQGLLEGCPEEDHASVALALAVPACAAGDRDAAASSARRADYRCQDWVRTRSHLAEGTGAAVGTFHAAAKDLSLIFVHCGKRVGSLLEEVAGCGHAVVVADGEREHHLGWEGMRKVFDVECVEKLAGFGSAAASSGDGRSLGPRPPRHHRRRRRPYPSCH